MPADDTHCKHGTYVGWPGGPDYMCGWCEDGISDEDYRAYHMNVAHRDALERNLLWDVCAEHDALTPDAREYITGTRS